MAIRTPNFTQGEKEVLFQIARQHGNILEDKKTNRSTLDQKCSIWKQIEAEFNNKAPVIAYRTSDQLKRLYENKKKDLRRKLADHKNQIYKTGGGPPPENPKLDPTDEILIEIMNEKTVFGFSSKFDSDAQYDISPLESTQVYEFSPLEESAKLKDEISLSNYELDRNIEIIHMPHFSHKKKKRYEPYEIEHDRPISPFHTNIMHSTGSSKETSATLIQKSNREELYDLESEQPAQVFHINDPDITSTPMKGNKKENRHPPSGLQKPVSKNLNQTTKTSRRRPVGGVRSLTSSDVAEKYNILLDKRLILVEKQIQQNFNLEKCLREEHEEKLKIFKQQNENLLLEKEEKKLKIDLLKLELNYKNSIFSSNV